MMKTVLMTTMISEHESVTVYYPSSEKIMLNFSGIYCVCLPVGHNMNVHYLSGAHCCQNVALRCFLFSFLGGWRGVY